MVNLSERLSSSARRRIRRTIKETTGSNLATCHIPLPDERADRPSAAPVPVQLSPEELDERFRLFVVARRAQVALQRGMRNPEEAALGQSLDISSGRSISARPQPAQAVVVAYYNWDFFGMANTPRRLQAGGPADVTALENSWALMPPVDPTNAIDTWDTDLELLSVIVDPSDIAETARHASRLLDAFSNSDTNGDLSSTQQRLLSTARTAILALTHASVDTAAQTDPLPPPVDVSMRPDATCVVCFARVVDTVLVPCWHLVLCGVRVVVNAGIVGRG